MNLMTLNLDHYWKSKLSYGLLSVAFLWVWGGGDFSNLALRALIVSALFIPFFLGEFKTFKTELLNTKTLTHALLISLGLGLFCGLLFHFSKSINPGVILGGGPMAWVQRLGQDLSQTNALAVAFCLIPLSALWAMISRHLLQKEWGLSGIAFLDALSLGLGAQSVGLFSFTFLLGCLWGFLFEKKGFALAFWVQVLSFSFFILSSWIFYGTNS
jgi:hypothetical protein